MIHYFFKVNALISKRHDEAFRIVPRYLQNTDFVFKFKR